MFSPFDDIEFICETHDLPCIGLCSYGLCKEKTQFLCMKCIKSGKTCITKEKHELITISELLYRFFLKMENKSLNINQIQTMELIVKEMDNNDINAVTLNYEKVKEENNKNCNELKQMILDIVNEFIQIFKNDNNDELNIIKNKTINKNDENNNDKELKLLLDMKIPNDNILKSKDNIIQYLNNKYKDISANDLVNQTKIIFNSNQLVKILKSVNNKMIINNKTSLNENKKQKLESEIDSILNDFENKLDKQMSNIEEKIIVKKNQQTLYTYYNFAQKFQNDPKELIFQKDICFNAHKANSIDSVFCAFTSFNKEALIVWGSTSYNIEFYDCNLEKIIKTFFHAHNQTVFSCRHYPDSKQRIDYIISSSHDRTVKVWDYAKNQYILNISNTHQGSYIYSVSLLCHIQKESNYIITSCPNEKMRIYDFNGSFLRDCGQDNESTYFIDVFYNKIKKKYYILNANSSDVKSYDFDTGNLFQRYKGRPQTWHMSVVINYIEENVVLIESDGNGYIRIWNFNTAELLKTIASHSSVNLRGICQWNDRYLFGAGNDNQVKLFDLEEGKFVTSFKSHTSTVCTIEKIMHPKYGGCLVTQALDGKLKLWVPKKE